MFRRWGKKKGCTCQGLTVEKPAAALGPTLLHSCHGNNNQKKRYIGLAVFQDLIAVAK